MTIEAAKVVFFVTIVVFAISAIAAFVRGWRTGLYRCVASGELRKAS